MWQRCLWHILAGAGLLVCSLILPRARGERPGFRIRFRPAGLGNIARFTRGGRGRRCERHPVRRGVVTVRRLVRANVARLRGAREQGDESLVVLAAERLWPDGDLKWVDAGDDPVPAVWVGGQLEAGVRRRLVAASLPGRDQRADA